ncbi:hypothetical protein ACPPVS_03715 [Cellulomonas sp. McL0617]|uniref:hypothetical protein n=1 Tax=Cellulomonas sp. McL0617 TaxID=3415675 RepID=UPI003CF703A7
MSMDGPQLGLLFGPPATYQEAHSAQPQAPVVVTGRPRTHHERRPPAARTRRSVAGVLHHLADAIAPTTAPRGGTATR